MSSEFAASGNHACCDAVSFGYTEKGHVRVDEDFAGLGWRREMKGGFWATGDYYTQ